MKGPEVQSLPNAACLQDRAHRPHCPCESSSPVFLPVSSGYASDAFTGVFFLRLPFLERFNAFLRRVLGVGQ